MTEPTILLAEDDDMVHAFVSSVLENHGCRVLRAHNGVEALWVAARDGLHRIDLLLTDIDMPALDGIKLVRFLKQQQPDLRVLYLTGHAGRLTAELREGCMVLEKPFSHAALVRSVEACLSRKMSRRAAN